MSEDKLCIGIDLGTTNSCLGYYNPMSDQVEIIPNSLGERLTPSAILFNIDETLIGQLAIDNQTEDRRCISYIKRIIGQKGQQCLESIDKLECEIEMDANGYPLIVAENETGEIKKYKAEEISSQVLYYLKRCAEDYLGQDVTEVVVTVPAYFNEAQRRATKDACTIAGLECLRLVAEPTAACLCYGLHKNERETILIFDCGGGTLDISILKLIDGIFEVIATGGNTQLGGIDIDYILKEYLEKKYQDKVGKEIEIEQRVAERVKKALSNMKQTTIRLPDFKYVMSRNEFENLLTEFMETCMEPIDQVLQDAELKTSDMSNIVLVGGTTRIPLIQQRLKEMFGNSVPINKSINPDEAVAYGATIQASILQKVGSRCRELLLLDVNPLSLGIETSGGLMNAILSRNSTLPCESSKIYSTVEDNQKSVEIKVYQGERQFTKDNISLAAFTWDGLPRHPRGVPKIKVTFKLNCDGLLEVNAVDKNTGLVNNVIINSETNLSSEEVDRLLEEAERYRNRDQMKRKTLEEVNKFEKYVYEVQRQVNLPEMKTILGDDLSPTNQYLLNTLDWIVANRESELEVIQNSRVTVEYNLKSYLDRMYSYRQELENAGIVIGKNENKVEHINEIIEDMCKDLK